MKTVFGYYSLNPGSPCRRGRVVVCSLLAQGRTGRWFVAAQGIALCSRLDWPPNGRGRQIAKGRAEKIWRLHGDRKAEMWPVRRPEMRALIADLELRPQGFAMFKGQTYPYYRSLWPHEHDALLELNDA